MFLNRDRKLAYLAMPRTASHSTSFVLVKEHGFKKELNDHHRTWSGDTEGWRIMTTVRNHFDWFTSFMYFVGGTTRSSPKEVLADHAEWFPKPGRLFGLHDVATDVLRFESIEEDVSRVLRETFSLAGREHFVGKRPHHKIYLSLGDRDWIEDTFGAEMDELGYNWGD